MAVLLEIKNASKRYGDQVLLDDTSATITDDGKVGFIGRNGAGKSTLLRVILGEEELDSGEVVRTSRSLRAAGFRVAPAGGAPFCPGAGPRRVRPPAASAASISPVTRAR